MESVVTKIDDDELRDDGAFVFHHPPKFSWSMEEADHPRSMKWDDYHLYVHVPFCKNICHFCTFERKKLSKGDMDWFIRHLDLELDRHQKEDCFHQAKTQSVYFGGGTASLLPNEAISHFMDRFRNEFGLVDEGTEITLECEPGSKRLADFQKIRQYGVNRISIGAQAFDDAQLRLLNRSHNTRQTLEMITAAKQAGFDNLHIDVMYGLPGQRLDKWRDSIMYTLEQDPTHISAYPLIVFEKEFLDRSMRQNIIPKTPHREVIDDMRHVADEVFQEAGLIKYSTAEYAKEGFQCRYVRSTWDGSDYLGVGPGAYSRNRDQLWENNVIHTRYARSVVSGKKPIGKSTVMSPEEQNIRDVTMGLCLLEIDLDAIVERSGEALNSHILETLSALQQKGFLQQTDNTVSLTPSGIRYATYVMKCFTNSL